MASFNLELNIACEHRDEMFYDKAGQFIVVYLVLSGFFFYLQFILLCQVLIHCICFFIYIWLHLLLKLILSSHCLETFLVIYTSFYKSCNFFRRFRENYFLSNKSTEKNLIRSLSLFPFFLCPHLSVYLSVTHTEAVDTQTRKGHHFLCAVMDMQT